MFSDKIKKRIRVAELESMLLTAMYKANWDSLELFIMYHLNNDDGFTYWADEAKELIKLYEEGN